MELGSADDPQIFVPLHTHAHTHRHRADARTSNRLSLSCEKTHFMASSSSEPSDSASVRVAVLTSYTEDYEIGHICSPINRRYAERHGYAYVERIYPPLSREAPPDRHPTWNKVALVNELLDEVLRGRTRAAAQIEPSLPPCSIPSDTTHLLWVDADAAIVRQDVSVPDLLQGLPTQIELVIGEDVTPCCLVNAGVFIARVSEWSAKLWRDVWSSNASRKFHNRRYHEQSSLLCQLERRGEGLDLVRPPFHSYNGGHAERKIFPHVAVLPRHSFNTNRADLRRAGGASEARAPGDLTTRDEDRCDFIFHAAGHPTLRVIGVAGTAALWRPRKIEALQTVIADALLDDLGIAGIRELGVAGLEDKAQSIVSERRAGGGARTEGAAKLDRPLPPRSYSSRYLGRIMN